MSQKIATILVILAAFLSSCTREKQSGQTGMVYLNTKASGYELVRNGKPFFVKGVSGEGRYLKELAATGANTIRLYDTLNLSKILDEAHSNGLAVIVDLPIPRYIRDQNVYETESHRQRIFQKIRKTVQTHKDHPALLFWMLGNEVEYPHSVFNAKDRRFIAYFNSLIDLIHQEDQNHPVSTAIQSIFKKRIISINLRSSQLDFISMNIFGQLPVMEKELKKLSWFWDGPFLISEWGDEGPWTEEVSNWASPMEATSSKKKERLHQKFEKYLRIQPNRNLGHLAFYWGHKQERTHTWFSLFSSKGEYSPSIEELSREFGTDLRVDAAEIDYILLDGRGQQESLILTADTPFKAEVFYSFEDCDQLSIQWELLPDLWTYERFEHEKKPENLNYLLNTPKQHALSFITPHKEGPYRLFVYLRSSSGSMSSANVNFYVMRKPAYGKEKFY